MFKLSSLLFAALVGFSGLSSLAQAEEGKVTSILYTCGIDFKASGRSIYVGLGFTSLTGKGKLSCYDILTGVTQHIPLKVTIRGPGAGLGVTGVIISGGVSGLGISRGPESLLGRYGAVRGSAAIGVGIGATTALKVSKGAVVLDLSIQVPKGLGAGLDLLSVNLEVDDGKKIESTRENKAFVTEPAVAPAAQEAPVEQTRTAVEENNAQVIYVEENQPVNILDAQGRIVKVIYLRKAR